MNTNNSVEKREFIFELSEKAAFLRDNPIARDICGHYASDNSFAQKLGIPRKTLLDSINRGGLSSKIQSELAVKCEFSLTWREWNDPSTVRTTPREKRGDTAAAFQKRYLKEHSSHILGEKAQERQTDVQLKRVRNTQPAHCDEQLATVELQASQSGPGQPWPVSVDLICNPSVIAGVEVAVKRGRLRLDCGKASPDLKSNIAVPIGYVFERPTGSVRLTLGGTSKQPSWEVQAGEGPIGYLSLPGDFCMVHQLAAGDVIRVRFLVYVMDLEAIETGDAADAEEGAPEADSLSFLRVGFRKLGSAKQKILKRIAEMQLPGGDTGLAVLAADELRFELAAPLSEEDENVR